MDITTEHPEYILSRGIWDKYSDLYAGGEQLRARAHEYLKPRPKEPHDVYAERLSRVFYENHIGSIIDWYAATLFRREPTISYDSTSGPSLTFYNDFTLDCDLHKTSFVAALRKAFTTALVYGRSYFLVDFPKTGVLPRSRADEEESGASRAYVSHYSPQDVINWDRDEKGELNWVVLRQSYRSANRSTLAAEGVKTRWIYFDRQEYKIFTRQEGEKKSTVPDLVDQGIHGFSCQNMVPLFDLEVPEGLWAMNKAALLQLEHFNKCNALAWALNVGLFAMPVVYTEKEWNQILGESYYLQLAPNDKFGWAEPEGHVYQIAATNLARLTEEIYRTCHLLHYGRSIGQSGANQSGLSKQQDLYITHEVLRAYGEHVKDFATRILNGISTARGDGLRVFVHGLDEFDISDFRTELENAKMLLSLGIESSTLKTQVHKLLASKFLSDAQQNIKDKICREIDQSAIAK